MRTTPRKRRMIGTTGRTVLGPFLRYSYTRDAYVLRGIGGRVGPVFVPRGVPATTEAPAPPADEQLPAP